MSLAERERSIIELVKDIEANKGDVMMARGTSDATKAKLKFGFNQLRLALLCQFKDAAALDALPATLKHIIIHNGSLSVFETGKRIKMTVESRDAWAKAKAKNNFAILVAPLQKLIDHQRDEANRKADLLSLPSAYDAQIDMYTRGLTLAQFNEWEADLIPFCQKAAASIKAEQAGREIEPFRLRTQDDRKRAAFDIMNTVFLREYEVTLGKSEHPMCLGVGKGARLGLQFDYANIWSSYSNVFHECGHGLYRTNIPQNTRRPSHELVAGAGLDESMAMIIENFVAPNDAVLEHHARLLSDLYGLDTSKEQMKAQILSISNSDEYIMSQDPRYMLDIILRKRMQEALFNDGLAVKDLPEFRAQEHQKLFGEAPSDPVRGLIRPPHIPSGYAGWAVAYLFGNLGSAQIYKAALSERPDIQSSLDENYIIPLLQWLDHKIYQRGSSQTSLKIIEEATGEPLGTRAYKDMVLSNYSYLKRNKIPEFDLI